MWDSDILRAGDKVGGRLCSLMKRTLIGSVGENEKSLIDRVRWPDALPCMASRALLGYDFVLARKNLSLICSHSL